MKNGMVEDELGNKFWYKDDSLHRLDGPAVEWVNGNKEWYQKGLLHREDGPAIINVVFSSFRMNKHRPRRLGDSVVQYSGGVNSWYYEGLLHRLDGPAIEDILTGHKEWYQNGKRHRLDGPAFEDPIICAKKWYYEGLPHRLDGPAVERTEHKAWLQNGKLHRLDGPAVEYSYESYLYYRWANKDCSFDIFQNVSSRELCVGKNSKSSIEEWDEWFSGFEDLPGCPRGSQEFKALEDLWKQYKAQLLRK